MTQANKLNKNLAKISFEKEMLVKHRLAIRYTPREGGEQFTWNSVRCCMTCPMRTSEYLAYQGIIFRLVLLGRTCAMH